MKNPALPNEESLFKINEIIADIYSNVTDNIKKAIPTVTREAGIELIKKYKPTRYLIEFGYFGYDSAAIKPYIDDPLHDHIEIIVNDLDEILGYRVYSDNKNSKRYSRPLNSVNDIEWVNGAIRRMHKENFSDDYTEGKLITKLEYDENFTTSGAADRLTDKDFKEVEDARLDIRELLVNYELSHIVYDRKDMRNHLGTIHGIEGTRNIYSIELPKSKKTFFDPNAFDWNLFSHFMKGWATYFILNNTIYRGLEGFIDWVNKFAKTANKDIIEKPAIQEIELQLAFRPKQLIKYNISYT